jgi:hypothetical protein
VIWKAYVLIRWMRLTTRRYGVRALVTKKRPRRAIIGRGTRYNVRARAHGAMTGYGLMARDLTAQLQLERSNRERARRCAILMASL